MATQKKEGKMRIRAFPVSTYRILFLTHFHIFNYNITFPVFVQITSLFNEQSIGIIVG